MDPNFFVPVSTMLAGLGLWIVYVVARALSRAVRGWTAPADVAIAAVVAGLVVVSGLT